MLKNLIDAHSHYFEKSSTSQRAHIIELIYRRILVYHEIEKITPEIIKELEEFLDDNRDFSSTHLMILLLLDKIENI